MTLAFQSPIMEEHEKKLMAGTLEERMEAFKGDAELMRETTKFITDVIETATSEANRRKSLNQEDDIATEGSRLKGGDIIGDWNNRARGFCNRIFNVLCPCFTNNGKIVEND